jgi:hypothetical protein
MSDGQRSLARSGALHAGFAFLAMGGWAVYANSGHAWPAPLMAGVVQGALSAAITLVLKQLVETIAGRFSGWAALAVPPAAAGLSSAVLLSAIHSAGGTPEIARTIAVPLAVSTSYAALYAWTLRKAREKRP